jgi:hypothetical protein
VILQASGRPQAFLSTDAALAPAEIIAIFVRRWQVEVNFSEVWAYLGVRPADWTG